MAYDSVLNFLITFLHLHSYSYSTPTARLETTTNTLSSSDITPSSSTAKVTFVYSTREYELSKLRLNAHRSNKAIIQNEVKFPSLPVTSSPHFTPIHRLDFLTLIIPFLFLFSVTVIIFLLNLVNTCLLSSPSPGLGNRYSRSWYSYHRTYQLCCC